jgi:predicted  nucleic acid-binding Zn-ribbon protein
MSNDTSDGLRARISKQGEDALGRLAQELLESPFVSGALARAFDAREKAAAAQEVAMGALNLPSAADLEKLTRRVRSVSQRLEGIEDALDRVEQRVGELDLTGSIERVEARIEELAVLTAIETRLEAIEARLDSLGLQAERIADQNTPSAPQPVITSAARRAAPSRTRAAAARRRAASRRGAARARSA